MILWIIRQLLALRKAVAGRAKPSELAWGLALGFAIGLIPKGNAISLFLIGFVMTLKVNHGLMALTAVVCTFASGYLDPLSHLLGSGLLETHSVKKFLDQWWDAPLVAWTDLNNTVVMGSSVIAVTSLVPCYIVSLPIFRWLAPKSKGPMDAVSVEEMAVQVDSTESDRTQAITLEPQHDPLEHSTVVETRIDVLRLPARQTLACDESAGDELAGSLQDESPEHSAYHGNVQANANMNEALRYLLNRLRDTERGERAA